MRYLFSDDQTERVDAVGYVSLAIALLLAIVLFARDGVMGGLRRAAARLGLGANQGVAQ